MAQPTILIGLGTAGKNALDNTWKFISEIDPANRANVHVQYIFLETDNGNTHGISDDLISSGLSLNDTATTINNIKNNGSTSNWIPDRHLLAMNAMQGAGGMPVIGRICLWDNKNFKDFQNTLTHARNKFIAERILDKPVVYIVGTLGGGTGSGTFLDMAYIIRNQFQNMVEVYAVLMIPGNEAILNEYVMYSNTVGALKELSYFNTSGNNYNFNWANGISPMGSHMKPFDLIQLISTEFDHTLGYETYEELCVSAGLFLFINSLGMHETRKSTLVDATGNIIVSNYTTFGMSAIRYPKSQIEEATALDISNDLLSRWVDINHYYDAAGNKNNISLMKIKLHNQAVTKFELHLRKVLEDWCTMVEVGENTIEIELHKLVEFITSDKEDNDKMNFLYQQFRAGGNFHAALSNNVKTPSDQIVEYIYSVVTNNLKNFENLEVTKIELNAISTSIEQTIGYWKSIGVDPDPTRWDAILQSEIRNLLPYSHKILPEKKKVYFDRLKFDLLYKLVMHVFARTISNFQKSINGVPGSIQIFHSINNTMKLPNIKDVNSFIFEINKTINSTIISDKVIERKRSELRNSMKSGSSKTMTLVFADGAFESDVKRTVNQFYQLRNNLRPSVTDITGSAGTNLWEFLTSLDNLKINQSLYDSVTKSYESAIKNKNLVGNFNIVAAINRDVNQLVNTVQKSLISRLPINPNNTANFKEDVQKIPRIICGDSDQNVKEIGGLLERRNCFDYKIQNDKRDTFIYAGLSNWVVFFKEFGYMSDNRSFNPVIDFRHYSTYQQIYCNACEQQIASKNIKDVEEWHSIRVPYISFKTVNAEYNKAISKADLFLSNREYEMAQKSYVEAQNWDASQSYAIAKTKEIKTILDQETTQIRKQRCIEIGTKYMESKDYIIARSYFEKVPIGDDFINTQMQIINQAQTECNTLVSAGDKICTEAVPKYNDAIKNRVESSRLEAIDCIMQAREIYNKALSVIPGNREIEDKIIVLNNYINA